MRPVAIGLAMGIAAAMSGHLTQAQTAQLGFFITSAGPGKGADLGGLAGADAHCQTLAKAAGAGGRTWRAYLSATAAGSQPAVNAKDRIGAGPWANAKGVVVATSVADLHSDANKLSKENSLTEKGEVVNGRGDTPNKHDILTGSTLEGTVSDGGRRLDLRQLDQQRRGQRARRPPRSDRRRRQPVVVELRARVEGLQPGEPARHRRRRAVLLLRGEIGERSAPGQARVRRARASTVRRRSSRLSRIVRSAPCSTARARAALPVAPVTIRRIARQCATTLTRRQTPSGTGRRAGRTPGAIARSGR